MKCPACGYYVRIFQNEPGPYWCDGCQMSIDVIGTNEREVLRVKAKAYEQMAKAFNEFSGSNGDLLSLFETIMEATKGQLSDTVD